MFDPTIGRWQSKDPKSFDAGDTNLYRYVGNHPSYATDPSGLQAPEKASIHSLRNPGDDGWHAPSGQRMFYANDLISFGRQLERGEAVAPDLYLDSKSLQLIELGRSIENGSYAVNQRLARYSDEFGSHMSFCMSCHDATNHASRLKMGIASDTLNGSWAHFEAELAIMLGPSAVGAASKGAKISSTAFRRLLASRNVAQSAESAIVNVGGKAHLNVAMLETPKASELLIGAVEPLTIGTKGVAVSPLAEGISRFGLWNLPETVLQAEITSMQSVFPSTGNFAFAVEEQSSGALAIVRGSSGQKVTAGLVSAPVEGENLFARMLVPSRSGALREHCFDPETKLLEFFGRKSKPGQILLYSENPLCPGCAFTADQFQTVYGNILSIGEGIPRSQVPK